MAKIEKDWKIFYKNILLLQIFTAGNPVVYVRALNVPLE